MNSFIEYSERIEIIRIQIKNEEEQLSQLEELRVSLSDKSKDIRDTVPKFPSIDVDLYPADDVTIMSELSQLRESIKNKKENIQNMSSTLLIDQVKYLDEQNLLQETEKKMEEERQRVESFKKISSACQESSIQLQQDVLQFRQNLLDKLKVEADESILVQQYIMAEDARKLREQEQTFAQKLIKVKDSRVQSVAKNQSDHLKEFIINWNCQEEKPGSSVSQIDRSSEDIHENSQSAILDATNALKACMETINK